MRARHFEAIAILGPLIAPILANSDSSRPRGVGPEFAKYYKSPSGFACIYNPSIQLSPSQINDDYCDCPDGSDEPGTSACSYISPLSPPGPVGAADPGYNTAVALPGFYCKNKGHRPAYIPFSYVNDGVCDYNLCCDGSDEWAGVGGVKCENKCKEIGKEWRKQDEARQKSLGAAAKKKKGLLMEAARLKKEGEAKLETLKAEIYAMEIKGENLRKEVDDLERRERGRIVKGPITGGKLSVLSSLAKARIATLRDNLEKVRTQRGVFKGRVQELEEILSAFKEEYNPNFNDEGVKRAVKRWDDYVARDKEGDEDAYERDLDDMLKPDEENGLNWNEFEGPEESDVDVLYKFEEYLPKPLRDWIDGKLRDLRVFLIDNGVLAASPTEGTESKAVSDAKSRRDAHDGELRDRRHELIKLQDDVGKDYGPDDIFRALKGRCIERDAGEYSYELCWMDRTTQKPKKGGGDTGMGYYTAIETITVDDVLPADGRGLGSGQRYALKFENGNHCWNGPARSTTVILACAEEDEIWKIVEEEKCIYRMEVGTPAVCEDIGPARAPVGKDEL